MIREQHQDILWPDEIEELIKEYEQLSVYRTPVMKKGTPGAAALIIVEHVRNMLGREWNYEGGNYYQHEKPYFPHTDFQKKWGESLRVVVPLKFEGNQDPSLVVFDQSLDENASTWFFDHYDDRPVKNEGEGTNIPLRGRPTDTKEVRGLTRRRVNNDLYQYLKWADRDSWFGMSGEVFPFLPKSVIMFDSKLIHATSSFEGTKLGLALHFIKDNEK